MCSCLLFSYGTDFFHVNMLFKSTGRPLKALLADLSRDFMPGLRFFFTLFPESPHHQTLLTAYLLNVLETESEIWIRAIYTSSTWFWSGPIQFNSILWLIYISSQLRVVLKGALQKAARWSSGQCSSVLSFLFQSSGLRIDQRQHACRHSALYTNRKHQLMRSDKSICLVKLNLNFTIEID